MAKTKAELLEEASLTSMSQQKTPRRDQRLSRAKPTRKLKTLTSSPVVKLMSQAGKRSQKSLDEAEALLKKKPVKKLATPARRVTKRSRKKVPRQRFAHDWSVAAKTTVSQPRNWKLANGTH